MAWYNPLDWIRQAKEYFSREETPEVTRELREDLRMYRRLLDIAGRDRASRYEEGTGLTLRLDAAALRIRGFHEMSQRVSAANQFLDGLRVNKLPPVF